MCFFEYFFKTLYLPMLRYFSAKGNSFLNVDGYNLGVHMNKFKRWGYRINTQFGVKTYSPEDEAKLALFDDFWTATQDDKRR